MKKLLESIYSTKATLWLLLVFTIAMAAATFIEDRYDTATAFKVVYRAKWFEVVMVLLALNFIGNINRYHLFSRQRFSGFLFHTAFILILIGAGITRYVGYEGTMHIREGESSDVIYMDESEYGIKESKIPFSLYLNDFILERYPGSQSPSSFASEVTVIDKRENLSKGYRIFMNHVLEYDGYRFFQSSYDEDERGTVLSVNHDYWGTMITYSGYLLLAVGFVLTLFNKYSRFYWLRLNIRELSRLRKAGAVIPVFVATILFGASGVAFSQSNIQKPVSKQHAEKFGQLIVQTYDGRSEPVHTFAYNVMHKISKKDEFEVAGKGRMDAIQVCIDMILDPDFWKVQKLIYIREQSVRDVLGISGKYATFNDFFDQHQNYKLKDFFENAFRKKQSEQNTFDKEVIKVNERVDIYFMVTDASLLKLFPQEDSNNSEWISWISPEAAVPLKGKVNAINEDLQLPQLNYNNLMGAYLNAAYLARESGDYSKAERIIGYMESIQRHSNVAEKIPTPTQVKWEVFYNKASIFMQLKNLYALLSVALMIFAFVDYVRIRSSKAISMTLNLLIVILGGAFVYHTFGMGLRWYLSGHAPWSNGYEALVLVAWGGLLAGFSLMKYSKITLAATTLLAFFTLMTASHSSYDPQITNLQPVLKSNWLIIHVATLTISYGFLGLGFILGIINLTMFLFKSTNNKTRLDLIIKELTHINEMNLTIGLILATAGTFLGAVWANESWGRYWGWDAKETWALIITIVYTLLLHFRLVAGMRGDYLFNAGSVLGFGSVLMTFIGVNYYLSKGMHSYASGDTPVFPFWGWVSILSVIALIIAAGLKEKSLRKIEEGEKILD